MKELFVLGEISCIGLKWPMTQMADGHLGSLKWPKVNF